MNCKSVEENLSAYLDNVLSQEEMMEIKSHLDSCTICREEYDALEKTVFMLSSLDEVIPPASFRRELRKKLEKEIEKRPSSWRALIPKLPFNIRNLRRSQLLPVAAALVLMVVLIPPLLDSTRMDSAKSSMPMEQSADMAAPNNYTLSGRANKAALDASFESKEKAGQRPELAAPDNMKIASTSLNEREGSNGVMAVQPAEMERKIIKNADVNIQVDDYDVTVEALKNKVISEGGYVANESVSGTGPQGIINGNLQVRLPALRFEAFLSGMEGMGKVTGRNIYTQDVTEEYVDVESRLKALRTKEERLLSILSKSGTLNDILAVENELANTRVELESLQGKLRFLNNRTEFSSINIGIRQVMTSTQQISTTGLTGVWMRAREAFVQAVNTILVDTGKLVVLVSSALPYLFVTGLLGLGIWGWTKRKK